MTIRLVIADDHPLILDALEGLFRLEEDIEVVGRCTDGVQTISMVKELAPDLLILDLRMPRGDGLDVLRALQEAGSRTRVILLTGAMKDWELIECLRLGVRGMVLKEMAPSMLLTAVHKVHAGETWVERDSMAQAVDIMLQRETVGRELAAKLTPREVEIVHMVADGVRTKEIARRLTVTEGTVKVHLHNIYAKLGVDGRVQLMKYAQESGLIHR